MGNGRGVSIEHRMDSLETGVLTVYNAIHSNKHYSDIDDLPAPPHMDFWGFQDSLEKFGVSVNYSEVGHLNDRHPRVEEMVSEINTTLTALFNGYTPDGRGGLPLIETFAFEPSDNDDSGGSTIAYYGGKHGNGIAYYLNPEDDSSFRNNYHLNVFNTRRTMLAGFHSVDGGIRATIAHEYGHAVEHYIKGLPKSMRTEYDSFLNYVQNNKVEAVSAYGSYNTSEAFAEAFAAYALGKTPRIGRDYYSRFQRVMRSVSMSGYKGSVKSPASYHRNNPEGIKRTKSKIYSVRSIRERTYRTPSNPPVGSTVTLKVGNIVRRVTIRARDYESLNPYKLVTFGGVEYFYDLSAGTLLRAGVLIDTVRNNLVINPK